MQVKRLNVGDEGLAQQAITLLKIETLPGIREKLNLEYLRQFLKYDRNYLLVAMIDREPVGFVLAYRLMRVDRNQDMMLFYEVVVDENHRNKGVGRELINHLKQICRENSVMKMWVSTNRSNAAAMELYRSTDGIERTDGDEVSFTYFPPYK
jgi:ribosomal protein S18 acetylase RimI-like enzyme